MVNLFEIFLYFSFTLFYIIKNQNILYCIRKQYIGIFIINENSIIHFNNIICSKYISVITKYYV